MEHWADILSVNTYHQDAIRYINHECFDGDVSEQDILTLAIHSLMEQEGILEDWNGCEEAWRPQQ